MRPEIHDDHDSNQGDYGPNKGDYTESSLLALRAVEGVVVGIEGLNGVGIARMLVLVAVGEGKHVRAGVSAVEAY